MQTLKQAVVLPMHSAMCILLFLGFSFAMLCNALFVDKTKCYVLYEVKVVYKFRHEMMISYVKKRCDCDTW